MEVVNIVILAISGLFLTMIGTLRLSNPIANYSKNSGIELANEVNLLNEVRGVSAVMLCAGIIILLGIFLPKLTLTSLVVATLIFLGFAIGRGVSSAVDGKPNKLIRKGVVYELVFGALNIFGLFNYLM